MGAEGGLRRVGMGAEGNARLGWEEAAAGGAFDAHEDLGA